MEKNNKEVSKNETMIMLENIKEDLVILKKYLKNSNSKIYCGPDVLEYLDISPTTLASYRNKGIIGFSQHGRKIYYTQSDLDTYIENYRKHTFNI